MKDMTQGKLKEALEAAQQMNNQSLQKCIDRLRETEKTYKSQGKECITEIFTDFAPLSFYFARTVDGKFSSNGGIIFHGKHRLWIEIRRRCHDPKRKSYKYYGD